MLGGEEEGLEVGRDGGAACLCVCVERGVRRVKREREREGDECCGLLVLS